ncbi:MAG: vanadium-dependent haloperoxidase [Acidobacteriota bacterium]
MRLPFAEPDPAGSERARKAKELRDLATEVSRLNPQALTRTNGEEADHAEKDVLVDPEDSCQGTFQSGAYPANFTKGLLHDEFGLVAHPEDYRCFVEAINSPDPTLFEKLVQTTQSRSEAEEEPAFQCTVDDPCCPDNDPKPPSWRGWESPRAGHVYELQGPDAGAVGMAPAPRVGSSELAVEMAEVYGLALLRDVPFAEIESGTGRTSCYEGKRGTTLNARQIVRRIAAMPFFGRDPVSSTPGQTGCRLNSFERNRRDARLNADGRLTPQVAFRGSTPGAQVGPYVSQFLLVGSPSLASAPAVPPECDGYDAAFDLEDGLIRYGSITINQRTLTHRRCVDFMTDWASWLDVQNGAKLNGIGLDQFEDCRRFITTPRDLATYVHYDALYEAYLNACLILLSIGAPTSKGFPEDSPSGRRTAFATFGGPHILSLVCEVATRCLKAVRRQKFNYHRRCRPEAIGGRLTLASSDANRRKLGCAESAFAATLEELDKTGLLDAIEYHNAKQNPDDRIGLHCPAGWTGPEDARNLLLPMAFPEGSPMHPAYGAGHATVAGGCVTALKAFFEMFEDCNGGVERPLVHRECGQDRIIRYVPNGDLLQPDECQDPLTIQGELDKLAANISIGRNMAGVHYYSDYYDSVRMGERITVGILMEQAPTYGDAMETTFTSFDGDHITISGEAGSCPSLSILDRCGNPVSPRDWWLRHVSGEELNEDL